MDPPASKDEDPDGARALAVPDGLEQAWKLLKPLTTKTLNRIDVCVVVYDVSVRRRELLDFKCITSTYYTVMIEKYLQAIKALLAARSLDSEDPELHVRIIDFKRRRECHCMT